MIEELNITANKTNYLLTNQQLDNALKELNYVK